MRCPAVLTLLAGSAMAFSQAPPATFTIDLRSHGWQEERDPQQLNHSPLTIDFADDDSLWVAFPTQSAKQASTQNDKPGKVLHIAATGDILAECDAPATDWMYLRLFAHGNAAFTLQTAERFGHKKLASFDARCKETSSYTVPRNTVYVSPDRASIYVWENANHWIVLSGEDLSRKAEFDLPQEVHLDRLLLGDRWIVYPSNTGSPGCVLEHVPQVQLSRMEIATGKTERWMTVPCGEYTLLGDDHVVYTRITFPPPTSHPSPLEIAGGDGGATAPYQPPQPAFNERINMQLPQAESPRSLRVADELWKSRGPLDTHRELLLLDMHTGTALATFQLPLDRREYSYALSRDGQKLALLEKSTLAFYVVP